MVYDSLKVQLYAISLSGILYGSSLCVFFETAPILLNKKQKNLMNVQFLIFITVMFLLGTAALAQGLFYLEYSGSIFLAGSNNTTVTVTAQELTGSGDLNYFTRLGVPISLPFTVLGSNGMMIWRLINLSRDITHKARFLFLVFLFLVSLSSLGGAIEFLIQKKLVGNDTSQPEVPIVPLATTIPNILLSTMVMLFLCRNSTTQQRKAEVDKNTTGMNLNQPTRSAITPKPKIIGKSSKVLVVLGILIESCALVALLSVIHIVLSQSETSTNTTRMVTLQMLPQACVLSSIWAVERIVKEDKKTEGPLPIVQGLGANFRSVVAEGAVPDSLQRW